MSTIDATTRPPLDAAGVVEDPRPFFRALAVEAARAWLASEMPEDWGDDAAHVEAGKAAVRALLHELEAIAPPPPAPTRLPVAADEQRRVNEAGLAQARQALADVRPLCPGGGTFITTDDVNGDSITTCPMCRQYRPARHTGGRWWNVAHHKARHLGQCLDEDGKLDACVCGLQDRIDRIHAAIAEAGEAVTR